MPQTSPNRSAATMTPAELASTVDAAFEYAFPLYEMARTRYGALENPANPARGQANVVGHRRTLADHRSRAVTTPNNDTLYSSCWLDLSAGPVRIDVARMPAGRYWSLALMDFFTNHIAVLGSRLDGQGPVSASLVAASWTGARPTGRVIVAPGHDVWLLGRWLVDGAHDLAAARAMQDGLQIVPSADAPASARVAPRASTDPEVFLAVVNQALARNPAPGQDAAALSRYAPVGLTATNAAVWPDLPAAVRAAWVDRIVPAHAALRRGLLHGSRSVQGWRLPPEAIGNFGTDHALRAAVALGGLAALEPAEAVYLSRETDVSGAVLDGQRRYRIRIPAAGVPSDAFWSLSVYERMPDGRLFFTENSGGRYAVGDRTPGLQRAADGSIDLWLQTQPPADEGQRANWLPAPPGPMQLSLRAYLPRPELREGRAALPVVQALD